MATPVKSEIPASSTDTLSYLEVAIAKSPTAFREGTTVFASPPSPTFRYSMTLTSDNTLHIWLEDCDSKEQWSSTDLGLSDFVDASNAIPNATTSDYFEYLHFLISCPREDAKSVPASFERLQDGEFRLEATLQVQVLKHSHVVRYSIPMRPILLERVDVLEAKMRDLRDVTEDLQCCVKGTNGLQDLQNQVTQLKQTVASRDAAIATLQEEVKSLQNASVVVGRQATTKRGEFVVWGSSPDVMLPTSGLYQLTAVISHEMNNASMHVQLLQGTACIQHVFSNPGQSSTMVTDIIRVNNNGCIAVKCPVRLTGTSYLTLVRLAK